jgi:hypothetical protein
MRKAETYAPVVNFDRTGRETIIISLKDYLNITITLSRQTGVLDRLRMVRISLIHRLFDFIQLDY